MKKLALAVGATALAALAGCATNTAMNAPADCRMGMLADWHGHKTLYTLDADTKDAVACTGYCTTVWPPLLANASDKGSGAWSTVRRADGTYQWAYNGKPVYTFAKDVNTGDKVGDNVKGPWGTWTALKCPS
jgi:predicted lipoprotein with Yx(FWY)xxD motif